MLAQRQLHRSGASARQAAGPRAVVQTPVGRPARLVCVCASTAKFFVGGNWKCNGTTASVRKLVDELNAGSVPRDIDVICAPPFLYVDYVLQHLDRGKFQVAAQNCSLTANGAYTGETSAEMLTDFGIPWVLAGHSERRSLFGESNETVGKKTSRALDAGLGVIACIGETLDQRQSGAMYQILDAQMDALFRSIKDWTKVVVAYEPVWAIGTGVVATPDQAQEVHAYLRRYCSVRLGKAAAEQLRIIYGGSVTDGNCKELAAMEDIDGFLVGGASLKGAAFLTICNAAEAKHAAGVR